jgi:hypothetical protein
MMGAAGRCVTAPKPWICGGRDDSNCRAGIQRQGSAIEQIESDKAMYAKNTINSNVRLLFSGDTVLLALSSVLVLSSLANATHWQALRPFQYCVICDLLLSLTFFLLTTMEAIKNPSRKRTMIAALLFFVATVLCVSGGHFVRGPLP